MSFNTDILKKYAKEGYNVLLSGKHGVGKTALIKEVFGEVFGEHNKSWMYFSSSTIDPWVDFIGIPKNYTTPDGKEVFKIIPPERLTGDEKIEAMFFDEINRADDKTLNALMELIQFKSINGRKFPHLKCIWAAENPADDADNDYSVTELDPAQKDRFQIQLTIPYTLNSAYFVKKYGKETYDISNKWWSKNKKNISPRKLDDMIGGYNKGFSLKDFTHNNSGIDELQFSLNSISDLKKLQTIIDTGNEEAITQFFTLDKIRSYEKILVSHKKMISGFYKYMDDEIKDYIERNLDYYEATELDMNMFNAEQQEFIKRVSNIKPYSYLNSNNIIGFCNHLKTFPFTLDNTPTVNYAKVVEFIFGFRVTSYELKTYTIQKIVDSLSTKDIINFYEVMLFMLANCNLKSNPQKTDLYVFLTKLQRSSKFNLPTKMDKTKAKNLVACIGNSKISKADIKGLFK